MNTQRFRHAGKRSARCNSGTVRAIERARDYLHKHYSEPISLDELVALTKLSRFHLVRAFTHHIGTPPHAYHLSLRIERACTLLRAGVTAAETAIQLGFADQSHFTRHFKRIWRITPSQYARLHAARHLR